MEKFELNRVLDFYKPDLDTVAKVLFPHNNFPQAALRRVLTGPTTIDANQIGALAEYLGVLVADLNSIDMDWKGSFEKGYLTFINGDYKAVVNYKGAFITVYKNNVCIAQEIASTTMSVESFIDYINNLIKANNK